MKSFTRQIQENWLLLSFSVGLIVSWTTFNTRLVQAEKDIVDLKSAVAEITSIKLTVQKIDTSVDFIKAEVLK